MMIKLGEKIYGERNDPDTVLASEELTNKWLVGAGNKGIKSLKLPPNSILISNGDGTIDFLDFTNKPDTVVAINYKGQLEMISIYTLDL